MRRPLRPAAALIGLTMVLASCQGSASESPAASGEPGPSSTATGGVVHVGYKGSPDSLNPGRGLLTESYTIYELVYDTPISIDPEGNYVPELATDWEASEDGLTYTMHLVDDAVFHDGTPMTSEDVKFSLETYRDNDFPYESSYPDVFVDIEAPDPTTVVLHTEEPVGNFEYRMVFMYILPKHIWESEDAFTFDNAAMIGTGSFKLKDYETDEFVELEAVKDHWNISPNIDGVIFQTIDNDDARVAALTEGDVDMITEFQNTAIPTLQNTENVEVVTMEAIGGSLTDLFFNVIDPADCPGPSELVPDGGTCSGHEALRDIEVRQALAKATDKQQLIDVATLGTGTVGVSLVPPGLGDYFVGADAAFPFDVDAANEQLDAAGYEDTDGDGVRECRADQDCDDLTFRFNYPDDSTTGARESELLDAMWSAVGVKIEIQVLDQDALTSVCCPNFDYDVIMWGWGVDPDPQFLLGVTLCENIENGFSETGYCNAAYDELYAAQAQETDHATRVDQIHEMQEILLEDTPYIIPYYYPTINAYRSDTYTGWLTGPRGFGLDDISSLGFIRPAQ
ncbi:MAG TPA: ABC transporter substrate-binding protein [Candidatus Limnocylindria bacterium]|nr:ABC transporter substrate-binding protein [Candidatus Limnocylindria bacterium]